MLQILLCIAHQIELQMPIGVRIDPLPGQRPEAGVDPVDGLVTGRSGLHHGTRRGQYAAECVRQVHNRSLTGNINDPLDGQGPSVKHERVSWHAVRIRDHVDS